MNFSALSQNFCSVISLIVLSAIHHRFLLSLRPSLVRKTSCEQVGSPFGADDASKIFLKRIGLLEYVFHMTLFLYLFLWFFSCFLTFIRLSFSLFSIFIYRRYCLFFIRTFDSLTSSDGFSLTAVFFLVVLGLVSAFSAFTSAFTSFYCHLHF